MKKHLLLIAIALFAFGFMGCSKQPQAKAVAILKAYNWGVVEVSDGVQTTHDLGDSRVCVITPALQKDGSVILNMKLEESGKLLEKLRAQYSGHRAEITMRVGDFSIALSPRLKNDI